MSGPATGFSVFARSIVLIACLLGGTTVVSADDDDRDGKKSRATATFGRGLNTARPGNAINHAVLPREIKIKAGGVVDFTVAGFHDIVVFKPGFTLEQLVTAGGGDYPSVPTVPPARPVFVIPPDPAAPLQSAISFLADSIYYRGINPAGGPLGTAVTGNPANGSNRNESVAFLERGTYLVICNILPHLVDGMYAYVKVD